MVIQIRKRQGSPVRLPDIAMLDADSLSVFVMAFLSSKKAFGS
jgi:hypothetical protein